jgi:hypothetical protein
VGNAYHDWIRWHACLDFKEDESLDEVQPRLRQFHSRYAKRDDHDEARRDLQAALDHAAIEASNLSHRLAGNSDARVLYRDLIGWIERGKGTIRDHKGVQR